MGKNSLKDVEANVDAGMDYDNYNNGTRQRYVDTQMNYAGGRDNEDGPEDANAMGHEFQYPSQDPDAMSKNPIMPGQDNYGQGSPVGDAIAHIAAGRASPQEMMMLHQAMSAVNPPQQSAPANSGALMITDPRTGQKVPFDQYYGSLSEQQKGPLPKHIRGD